MYVYLLSVYSAVACPRIRNGGAENLKGFYFFFTFLRGGGPAQKIAEKMEANLTQIVNFKARQALL